MGKAKAIVSEHRCLSFPTLLSKKGQIRSGSAMQVPGTLSNLELRNTEMLTMMSGGSGFKNKSYLHFIRRTVNKSNICRSNHQ